MPPSTVTEVLALDAAVAIEGPAAAGDRCRNCGTPLAGPFCSGCGQKDTPPDPTLREIVADAWESLTDIDGKIGATLKLLLTRPGALTSEYLAGRRARFLAPFRLYLICSVAFFLVSSLDVEREFTGAERREAAAADSVIEARIDSGDTRAILGGTSSAFEARLKRGSARMEASGRKMNGIIRENVPNAMFVVLPVYALLLAILYRSRRRRYPAHLVFALHAHAFFFAVLALESSVEAIVDAWTLPEAIDRYASRAIVLALLLYFPAALRRVYGGRWIPTVLRAVTLAVLYGAASVTLLAGAVVGYLYVLGS